MFQLFEVNLVGEHARLTISPSIAFQNCNSIPPNNVFQYPGTLKIFRRERGDWPRAVHLEVRFLRGVAGVRLRTSDGGERSVKIK